MRTPDPARRSTARRWSLSFLVALWIGLAVAVLLGLFIVIQYITTPDVSLSELILKNLVRLIIFGAVIHVLAWLIIRSLVLGPIDRLHRHLYRIGTGRIEEIDLATRVQELQTLEDGVNLMVQRMKHGGLERAVEVTREQAAAAEVPEWIIAAGDRPAHLSMSLQQSVTRKEGAGLREWWPVAMVVLPLVTVIGLAYWLQPERRDDAAPEAAAERAAGLDAKLDQVLAAAREQGERLDRLESSLRQDVRKLHATLAASAAGAGADTQPRKVAAAKSEEWAKAVKQLAGRIDALETAHGTSEAEIATLREKLSGLVAAGTGEDPDLADRLDALLARLARAEVRVDELEGITATVAGGASRDFFAVIERFMGYQEANFSLIRGARVRNDRLGERGLVHRSREPFPGAVSTRVWDVGNERWCEVVLHENESRNDAMGEFERLEADVNNMLPDGWNMTPVRVRNYEAAQKIMSPDGGSFRVACYEVREGNSHVWVTVLQFGR